MFIQNRLGLIEGTESILAQEQRMNQISNNLANVDTPGYKKENITFWEMLYKADGNGPRVGKALKVITDQEQGTTSLTGRDLDFAILGDGFFKIQTPRGDRYTRAGNFQLNSLNQLTTPDGSLVMGAGGPLVLEGDKIVIDDQGRVSVDGEEVDQLAIVSFADTNDLEKEGGNFFRVKNAKVREEVPVEFVLHQGTLETSNVNSVLEMTEMIDLQRAYETQQKIIITINEVDGDAVRKVGRLTG